MPMALRTDVAGGEEGRRWVLEWRCFIALAAAFVVALFEIAIHGGDSPTPPPVELYTGLYYGQIADRWRKLQRTLVCPAPAPLERENEDPDDGWSVRAAWIVVIVGLARLAWRRYFRLAVDLVTRAIIFFCCAMITIMVKLRIACGLPAH